jgi:hypothetical protein
VLVDFLFETHNIHLLHFLFIHKRDGDQYIMCISAYFF